MKKLFNWQIIFLVLISIVALLPLFHSGVYVSHDGEANIARFAAYFKAFSDYQFPPRWAGNLNFGYGSPIFIFYYPLPGYLASFLHLFGITFQNIFKLIMAAAFLLNGLFFYFLAKKIFQKEIAIVTSFAYMFSPYHFLDMYVRGDVAEVMALAFVPLVFLFIENFLETKRFSQLLYGGFFYGLMILAHNGISLIFSPLLFFYCFFRAGNLKLFSKLLFIFILGLFISSFFWIPAIFEARYVNAAIFIGDNFKNNFLTLRQIVFSNWGFGPDVNKIGGLSPQIGIVPMMLIAISPIIFLKNFKKNKIILYWISAFLIFSFMITSSSGIIWRNFSIIRLLEFPWRFMAVSGFIGVIIIGYSLNLIKNKLAPFIFLLFFLISILPFIVVQGYENKTDTFYESFPYTTYFHGEASSVWTAGDFGKKAKSQFEIISGKGQISNIYIKSNKHIFDIKVDEKTKILDNTVYFPSWRVEVDGKKVPVEFQDMNHRGLITFDVPKGKHLVKVEFRESPIRLISDIISAVSIGLIFLMILFRNKLKCLIEKL